jgi:FAD/FMN-containing dehydrogenase
VSPDVPTDVATLVAELVAVVGVDHVLTDPAVRSSYEIDVTGLFGGSATAVVRPGSVPEVAGVLEACRRAGVAVVVQGGATGLVGGSVPAGGEVVLSTRRLATVGGLEVDAGAASVVVDAGATLAAVQAAVRPHGWDVGVDLASRDSATVGGMVGTDAGGEHVLRYGRMREQVVALRATLSDGTQVGGLTDRPGSAGDRALDDVLVGSEGILAVVTQARLRLIPLNRVRAVALVGVSGVDAALGLVDALDRLARTGELPAPLTAAELMLAPGMALVLAATGLPAPVAGEPPAYVLVEVAEATTAPGAGAELVARLAAALDGSGDVLDAALAWDPPTVERLWRYRESHPEAVAHVGRPVKLDVSVPADQLAGLVADLDDVVARAAASAGVTGTRVVVFGHLGVGNLHVNVLGLDRVPSAVHAVTDAVLRTVAARGGGVSAEHGIGRAKVEWLSLARTAAEVDALTAWKRSLDPTWTLGPGVLLPARSTDDPQTGRP